MKKLLIMLMSGLLVLNNNVPSFALNGSAGGIVLPKPGTRLNLSPVRSPALLKGIKVYPDDPLHFEFVMDQGDAAQNLRAEAAKMVKYFLASLTIPQEDLWVNLSPYEKNRIVPENFGNTQMGRDLLAQDYLLKQITASLIYPEGETGKKFWKKIYETAARGPGNTRLPMNAFNKVWVVPDKATVYVAGASHAKTGAAYIAQASLKVMTEADYLANARNHVKDNNQNRVIKEVIIPLLTKEINEGENFAGLRQVYHALILANWYKHKIHDSIINQVYSNHNQINGVAVTDPNEKQEIYRQYLEAFKKGAYNYIKEEEDPVSHEIVPRKYFSGGATLIDAAQVTVYREAGPDQLAALGRDKHMSVVDAGIAPLHNKAMTAEEAWTVRSKEQDKIDSAVKRLFSDEGKDVRQNLDVDEDFYANLLSRLENVLDLDAPHNQTFIAFLEMYLNAEGIGRLKEIKPGFTGQDLVVFLQRLHTISANIPVAQVEGKAIPVDEILKEYIIEDALVHRVLVEARLMQEGDVIVPDPSIRHMIEAGEYEHARAQYTAAHGIEELNILAGLYPDGVLDYLSDHIYAFLKERDLLGNFHLDELNRKALVIDVMGRIDADMRQRTSRSNRQRQVLRADAKDDMPAAQAPAHVQGQASEGITPVAEPDAENPVEELASAPEADAAGPLDAQGRARIQQALGRIIMNLAKANQKEPKEWSNQQWGQFRSAFVAQLKQEAIGVTPMFQQAIDWYIKGEQIKAYVGHYRSLSVQDLVAIIQRIHTVAAQDGIVHGVRPSSFEKNGQWKGLDLNQFMDVYQTGFSDAFIHQLAAKLNIEYHFEEQLPFISLVRAAVMDMPEKISKRHAYLQEDAPLANELMKEGLGERVEAIVHHVMETMEETVEAGQVLRQATLVGSNGLIIESAQDGDHVVEYKNFQRGTYVQASGQVLSHWLAENWGHISAEELVYVMRFYVQMQEQALKEHGHLYPSVDLMDIMLQSDRMVSASAPMTTASPQQEKDVLVKALLWFLTGHKFYEINAIAWAKAKEELAGLWGQDKVLGRILPLLQEFYGDGRISAGNIIVRLNKMWSVEDHEKDPIVIAGVQDKIGGIVEDVLAAHAVEGGIGIEAITASDWVGIADDIYRALLVAHEGDARLVSDDFHDLLRRYLTPEQLMAYKNKFLTHPVKSSPRPLQTLDIVTIVEFLHTLSVDPYRLGFRREMFKYVDLDVVMKSVGFTYKLYKTIMSRHDMVGEAWDSVVADPQAVALLKGDYHQEDLSVLISSPAKIKAICEVYGIRSVGAYYFGMFREIMLANSSNIRAIIGEAGALDDQFINDFWQRFYQLTQDDLMALLSFKASFNRGAFLHLKVGRVIEGKAMSVQADALYYPRSATPDPFVAGQPVRFRFEEVQGQRYKDLKDNLTPLHRLQQEGRLPFVRFKNIFDWQIRPRLVVDGVITQKVMDQLAQFTDGFTILPQRTAGRVLDMEKLVRRITAHYKVKQTAATIVNAVRAMVKNQVAGHFIVLTERHEAGNMDALVKADIAVPDSDKRLIWARGYMKMAADFYAQGYFIDDDDIAPLYVDGTSVKLDNPMRVIKKNASNERNAALKAKAVTSLFKILLGIDITPLTGDTDRMWQLIDEMLHHDFHGSNLEAAQRLVAGIKALYHQWDWKAFFALAADAAMTGPSPHEGGIDFKKAEALLHADNDADIHFNISPAMAARLQDLNGFAVTIKGIKTLASVKDFLLTP